MNILQVIRLPTGLVPKAAEDFKTTSFVHTTSLKWEKYEIHLRFDWTAQPLASPPLQAKTHPSPTGVYTSSILKIWPSY